MFNLHVNEWRDQNADVFLGTIKNLLKSETFSEEVAEAIAFNHHTRTLTDSTHLMDRYNLKDYHAVCFLDYKNGRYKEEVNEEFSRYLQQY